MGWLEIAAGIILGGAALAGIIFLAKIAFDAIRNWINRSIDSHPSADTAILVRQRLENGNYRVVGGVFENNRKLDTQTWEGKELDDELKAEFGRKQKIIYDLT